MRALILGIALCGLVTTLFGITPPPQAIHAKAINAKAINAKATANGKLPAVTHPLVSPTANSTTPRSERPLVQFAICLDTSGSMEGLIDSARQKLWAITNELALAEPTPRLEVALFTFGNDGHNPENGWVAKHLDFTQDLDAVSELLFSFVTNGGTELVGRVLQAADQQLSWDENPQSLRLLFVAGNESADQDGEVPFRDAASKLIARDITVNSIYCGNPEDAIAPGWREVALRGDGHFASIDQNGGTLTIATPFDAELTALGTLLNTTYVPYGATGQTGWANQSRQDSNAAQLNSDAAASRATCKASSNYSCGWDLVDMVREKQIDVTKIVLTDLPESLQSLTIEQVVTHVDTLQVKRSELQEKVAALSKQRQAFLDAEMAKLELTGENAFDTAVRTAIRERAQQKGFRFPTQLVPVTVSAPTGASAPVLGAPASPAGAAGIQLKVSVPTLLEKLNVELSDTGC